MTLTTRGEPDRLTWALFDFPAQVHAFHGKFAAGVRPTFPEGHIPDAKCPCKPTVDLGHDNWYGDAAPKPLYEHRR